MHVLAINSATKKTEIALLELPEAVRRPKAGDKKKPRALFEKSWRSEHNEAEKLIPHVASILKKWDVRKIFIVDGPGAFTGLRVGVTLANTLAYARKIKLVSCSTFDFFSISVPDLKTKQTATILPAGGDFIAALLPGAKTPKRLHKADLSKTLQKKRSAKFVAGDLSPAEKRALTLPKGVVWIPASEHKKLSAVCGIVLNRKHTEHALIKPRYLLPPKITQSKKKIFT